MANAEHLALIQQGTTTWNNWRIRNPESLPDLSAADLIGANLIGANFSRANFIEANLTEAELGQANLVDANLRLANLIDANLTGAELARANLVDAYLAGAKLIDVNLGGAELTRAKLVDAHLNRTNLSYARLIDANFTGADLTEANLIGANLVGAILIGADLRRANLSGALLNRAQLIRTDLRNATLTGSWVYGASVWDIKINKHTLQQDLAITDYGDPIIAVDNIKVAQFIYLLLNNEEVRDVIDTITSKAVLILGRFTPQRKIILDRLREELRTQHYVPIMFDFEKPKSRDTIETIRTLAGMSKFIIADVTDAKSVVQELQAIVPDFPSVPVRFIIIKSQEEPGMFDHLRNFRSVVTGAFKYENPEEVIRSINESILEPVAAKLKELSLKEN